MAAITYIIADDHALFRKSIRLTLDSDSIHCIAEAESGIVLFNLLKTQSPDVVLLDIKMPYMDGLEVLEQAREQYPHIKFVVLTMQSNSHMVSKLMQLGASSYLLKNAEPEAIKQAIVSAVGK